MLGAGAGCAGGDPLHDSAGSRGPGCPKLEPGSKLANLLSELRALPDSQLQPWHRRHPQDSSSIRSIIGVRIGVMEQVHGVDVSWLHHTQKDHFQRKPSRPSLVNDVQSAPAEGGFSQPKPHTEVSPDAGSDTKPTIVANPQATSAPTKEAPETQPSSPGQPIASAAKTPTKRPGLLSRSSSNEKLNADGKPSSRRSTSWISNISSKFSSQGTPERPGPVPTQPLASASSTGASPGGPNGAVSALGPAKPFEAAEVTEPYFPSKPKESSFFSSLTRKLSAGSQTNNIPKVHGKGGMCERRVLNMDPNRQRILVPDMEVSRLRKVSFCVDVEIAGGPRYRQDEDDDDDRLRKRKDAKLKERAEGEALKHPEALQGAEEGKSNGTPEAGAGAAAAQKAVAGPDHGSDDATISSTTDSAVDVSSDGLSTDSKGDKKKKTDEERRERREKRRRRAEENGSIPVELTMDGDDKADQENNEAAANATSLQATVTTTDRLPSRPIPSSKRDKPTTDPVRIYRRCCQLRETPILKRITEQLMSPTCSTSFEPGVVQCLDLTGSRLQLADMITLGDWLAVVPVKKLLLEDADLNDEGLRCILAGLLAAKKPEPSRRKHATPKHRMAIRPAIYQERSGLIEKLTLKNNPGITRIGWKHISLFLYMCRSIKAVDLSMIQFPDTLPSKAQSTPARSPQHTRKSSVQNADAGETFFKCLSERLGGSALEELSMSECEMTSAQIRKVVDGAIICGITRLGLAGNHIDDQSIEHVLHYLRSGVCGGLDIGGNDLRGKLGLIANALNVEAETQCWGLSLAGCNLDTASLKALFPALQRLPNFRFIDFSHNPDLCGEDNGTISLLRRYLGEMKNLKRIHLADVGMSPKQAIALADVIAEAPQLAHISILENPEISALASAQTEEDQEEACALYASYMVAVRVSNTLICIDIDVPSPDNSEIVKALAKQVVAYSLRNMEQFALVEATGLSDTSNAAATLTEPHGGEKQVKEITVPDILMHLVGHVDGVPENHDNDDPAPDEDYIVGGTGVVKALQYVLGEKANDLRRSSVPGTPIPGTMSPRHRPGSSADLDAEQQCKAKKMSKNLLESARKIRFRLQPALVKEEAAGDEMAYRKLLFLDNTLQNMIQRFEEEFPETRIAPASSQSTSSELSSAPEPISPPFVAANPMDTTNKSDEEEELDDDGTFRPAVSRHNSDVSLASRALALEEGHLHRLGMQLRREIVETPAAAVDTPQDPGPQAEVERLRSLQERIDSISGSELKVLVAQGGWDAALKQIGANATDLRSLQEQDPQGWEKFVESQLKARMNLAQEARES